MTTLSSEAVKIADIPTHEIYQDYYRGFLVELWKEKATGTIYFSLNSLPQVFGYSSVEEMMSDDLVLDVMNNIQQETGEFPVQLSHNPEG